MRHPNCSEIAGSLELWLEYVGPGEPSLAAADFDEMPFDDKLAMIHKLWPEDCNCNDDDD